MEQQTGAMEGDDIMMSNAFYKGKKVLITGNTGFKGSWLCQMLLDAGAKVHGYSLEPPTQENLYDILKLHQNVETVTGDVRDYEMLADTMQNKQPEIVIHLAAQPIVRESYARARETFDINVMGTVNVLESVRHCGSVKSVLNVTTDKVYENKEWCWGYREHDTLNGFDPYSNSKSCSELVTHSYFHCEGGKCHRRRRFCGGPDYSRLCQGSKKRPKDQGAQSLFRQAISACIGRLVCLSFVDRKTMSRSLPTGRIQCGTRGGLLCFYWRTGQHVLQQMAARSGVGSV